MTTRTIVATTALFLVLGAGTAAAQRGAGAPADSLRSAERLHAVRMERLQRALALSDEETARVRQEMERLRDGLRDALDDQRETMRNLHGLLREKPVRQEEVERHLDDLERLRQTRRALEREHRERLAEFLDAEQRAKLMLFSQRFEERLREMMRQRGSPGRNAPSAALRPPDGPPEGRAPRAMRRGFRQPPGADPAESAEALRTRIERMERQLERMRAQLRSIEGAE